MGEQTQATTLRPRLRRLDARIAAPAIASLAVGVLALGIALAADFTLTVAIATIGLVVGFGGLSAILVMRDLHHAWDHAQPRPDDLEIETTVDTAVRTGVPVAVIFAATLLIAASAAEASSRVALLAGIIVGTGVGGLAGAVRLIWRERSRRIDLYGTPALFRRPSATYLQNRSPGD